MANLFVGLGGYATIQEAIDAASDGDHILVSAGTYGAFTVDKSVTVEGEGEGVEIVGSFRADNGIPLNTSVAQWLQEAAWFDESSGNGIHVCADGVTLSNLQIASFVNGIVFDDADDLVLDNVHIAESVVGILKDGDDISTGFRMSGGSISNSYMGISIETDGKSLEPAFAAIVEVIEESIGSPFHDVVVDGVTFTNITAKGIYADALSNALLLNLVMTNVGKFGQGPAFGPPWMVGEQGFGIDIHVEDGNFDDILINGFVMTDVGSGGGLPNSDGAAIALREKHSDDWYELSALGFGAAVVETIGNVVISNGIINGTSTAYRLGTDGESDELRANISVQNVLVNGYGNATLDNQSDETLYVIGTTQGDLIDASDRTDGELALHGVDGNDRIIGGWSDDHLDGGNHDDLIFTRSGVDTAIGGGGNDGVYFGAYFNQGDGYDSPGGGDSPIGGDAITLPYSLFDQADGGTGIDTFVLHGNYSFTTLARVTNFELLLLASGSDPRFDFLHPRQETRVVNFPEAETYFYNILAADSLVAAGTTFSVMGSGLTVGESLIFNGALESDGAYRMFAGNGLNILTGGDGNDGFMFGGVAFDSFDRVNGGDGVDSIAFRGDYSGSHRIVLGNLSIANVEIIALLSGHSNEYGGVIMPGGLNYELIMADGNVTAGQRLDIIAGSLRANESLTFDGSEELNGSFRVIGGAGADDILGGDQADQIYGGLGADEMNGGEGADTYIYRSAQDSTAAQADWLTLGAGDKIDLSGIGAGSSFSFIGGNAFGNVANQLRVFETGGHWVVEADVNGDGAADLVINVASPAALTADHFLL